MSSNLFMYENKEVGKVTVEWTDKATQENKQEFIEKTLSSFRKLSNTEERTIGNIEIIEKKEEYRGRCEKNLITLSYGYFDDGDIIVGPIIVTCIPNREHVRKTLKKILEMRNLIYKISENLERAAEFMTEAIFDKNYYVCNYIDKYYCEVCTVNYGRVYGRSKDCEPFLIEFRDSSLYLDPILNLNNPESDVDYGS